MVEESYGERGAGEEEGEDLGEHSRRMSRWGWWLAIQQQEGEMVGLRIWDYLLEEQVKHGQEEKQEQFKQEENELMRLEGLLGW